MACFTDLNYADRSYQLLRTLATISETNPIALGCYAEMNDSGKMFQFYSKLALIAGYEDALNQNCFEQLTEDAQWNLLNEALLDAFTPPPL